MDFNFWINLVLGLACFGLGAFLLVWFGMNFIGSVSFGGGAKLSFMTFFGTVCSIAMAWSGITLLSGVYSALF